MEASEEIPITYLIKVKMRNLVKLLEPQDWEINKKDSNVSTVTFMHKCGAWEKERKFVGVRVQVGVETKICFFPYRNTSIFVM